LPKYIADLLYQPSGKSIIEEVLKKQNLNILYILLNITGQTTGNDFYDYLNKNLAIDPAQDNYYLNLKKQLIQSINTKDSKAVQDTLDVRNQILLKFIILSKDPDLLYVGYFNKKIWPGYPDDLYSDLITTAIDSNNLRILYVLLNNLIIDATKNISENEFCKICF